MDHDRRFICSLATMIHIEIVIPELNPALVSNLKRSVSLFQKNIQALNFVKDLYESHVRRVLMSFIF